MQKIFMQIFLPDIGTKYQSWPHCPGFPHLLYPFALKIARVKKKVKKKVRQNSLGTGRGHRRRRDRTRKRRRGDIERQGPDTEWNLVAL